jgi:uncharacterized membrane protein
MSGGWVKYVTFAVAAAAGAHAAGLWAYPRWAMSQAMDEIGGEAHIMHWRAMARADAGAGGGAYPNADFAIARCAFDLRRGPVSIRTAPWGAYWSVSLYGENSDNFFTLNDREAPRGADILLIRAGKRAPASTAQIVTSPSARGVAIMRRLAPSAEGHAAAQRAGQSDVCAAFDAATS